ncbi:Fe2+-enterobactin ABC transporter substrate-binding protein [Pseudomonas sp. B21-009]|uniref:Fe2+-enterobactin ABC transporter substrate-binding protein n=2 Tax=Pseudomonas TaxID=286 RepID=UPI001E2B0E6B|nr:MULTISPECIES: Fe2+-enterobactin ABC transporter substrate-binding protein [unclassified Pseudomonas]UVL57802.1 Fe2+-enterobactin ABC transporter substrate-binding protein [Pseudomonas sp. B21-035]UVM68358.1 Fe2+-enterobactin ABC transporter substrate-binding protein [Pseudomonas sp. B21-009]
MPMKKLTFAPMLAVAALILLACSAVGPSPASAASEPAKPLRIASTSPSVTGILLAMEAPLVASAATTPSRMTDSKGFFSQWAAVADQRKVEVLYPNLVFDIESVIGVNPDLLVLVATGADSVVQHQAELEAQGIATVVVNYSNQSWQQIATRLGQAAGLQAQAAAAIKDFDDYTARAAATIKAPVGGVSIVGYNIGGSYSVGRASSPQARLFTALGIKVASLPPAMSGEVTRAVDFEFISRENLSAAITGESVFLLGGTDADVQAFVADPLLANLPAVVQKKVYALGPTSFRIDYYSGRQMIDTVARHLR